MCLIRLILYIYFVTSIAIQEHVFIQEHVLFLFLTFLVFFFFNFENNGENTTIVDTLMH